VDKLALECKIRNGEKVVEKRTFRGLDASDAWRGLRPGGL
jgi:hypothetical protein